LIPIKKGQRQPEDFMKEVFLHVGQGFLAEDAEKIACEKGKDELSKLDSQNKEDNEIEEP